MSTFADEIVTQLKRGGALNDPRAHDRTVPLADYVKREVQRSIDRVRFLSTYKPPDSLSVTDEHGKEHLIPVPKRTLADYRKAAKALREVAFFKEHLVTAEELEAVEQEPPERSNALNDRCAAESYFLMEMFSAKAPTGYETGTFRSIAVLICRAVSGKIYPDLKRACDTVLRSRRRFPHRF
jgi:hypothetical protein